MKSRLTSLLCVLTLLLAACGSRPKASPTSAPTQPPGATQPVSSPPTVAPTSGAQPTAATATSAPTASSTTTAALPATSGAPTDALSPNDPELVQISQRVAQLRGLPLLHPIKDYYLTRDQLRQRLIQNQDKDYPVSEAQADQRLLSDMGLIPKGFDLRKLYINLLTEEILGFYDPQTHQMYVINSGKSLNAIQELTYAHETDHALQDQHFNLGQMIDKVKNRHDDSPLALQALYEGDARTLERDYLASKPELLPKIQQALQENPPSTAAYDSAPPIISRTLLFPYEEGQNFVLALKAAGGWDRVDQAYADPPTTTEQILHPDKYLQNRDEPTPVNVPVSTIGSALPGWKQLETNSFGEFQTDVLLEGKLSDADAEKAGAGWDGDQVVIWSNSSQDVIVWDSVWDSTQDAQEFDAAMREYDQDRLKAQYTQQGSQYVMSADNRVFIIEQDGTKVHYVIAPSQQLAAKVLSANDSQGS